MDSALMRTIFEDLPTAPVADACQRLGIEVRCAPHTIRPLVAGTRVLGRVRPARHCGGIDVFLEALEQASAGEALVIDNGGRLDEACIGDLMALEVKRAALTGIVLWGLHRDTAQLLEIGIPVFSMGSLPARPQRIEPRNLHSLGSARIGQWVVGTDDFVTGDDDGMIFVPIEHLEEIATLATRIRNSEKAQTVEMHKGVSLRSQIQFSEFLQKRSTSPTLTFPQHMRTITGVDKK